MTRTATSIIPTRASPGTRDRGSWLDRRCRAALGRHLAKLHTGRLALVENGHRQVFGSPTEDELHAQLIVHRSHFHRRATLGGSLGAAESFLQGDWSSDRLTDLLRIFIRNMDLADDLDRGPTRLAAPLLRLAHRARRNSRDGSRRNIQAHYDLGNDFFELFLDPTMTYSCGIFKQPASSLQEASEAKLDRICRKLQLGPEDHVLEIGTGWGSFAIHAARHHGCRVTTTTISARQHEEAERRVASAGLSGRVQCLQRDYRDLDGKFDKLVSIEMIEAVGHAYLDTYFGKCSDLLADGGMMLLQAINMNDQRYHQYLRQVDFIQRYVFPGSCCPSLSAITASLARATDLRLFHLEEIGPHYATTLRHWRQRLQANAGEVTARGYPDSLLRLWD
ncbi:MAG: cyclopropane-fatty-acyl-phospholipid synthase family protein, partial [Phycisphaerae bacterium]|nr:cyclopropane-fatty-acyl-phospholipid synthase family protein [Phycisphaerae bacterium]